MEEDEMDRERSMNDREEVYMQSFCEITWMKQIT
jgi:hypothetical protein